MVRVLIADDETPARKRLAKLLAAFGDFEVAAETADVDAAISAMGKRDIDVAFLDIQMPGPSILDAVRTLERPPLVVFQTAFSEYAVDAFDVRALDYLLKPVDRARLAKTVERIRAKLAQAEPVAASVGTPPMMAAPSAADSIPVRHSGAIRLVPIDAIRRISVENGLCFIYFDEQGRLMGDKTLGHYDTLLAHRGFYRTSRDHLVRVARIAAVRPFLESAWNLELDDKSVVPLSRRRASGLKKLLGME